MYADQSKMRLALQLFRTLPKPQKNKPQYLDELIPKEILTIVLAISG